MNQFEVPGKLHDQLNPIIWDSDHLKKPVELALLKIAKTYYKFLGIDARIIDLVVSGSQANYNYSPHSDLDLHLIVPYSDVECDMEVDELFDTKRKLWKEQHDITIYGIPVELYVEDVDSPAVSSTYSLIKNQWIRPPKKNTADIDSREIERLCLLWVNVIKAAIATKDLAQCQKTKKLLWAYRQVGLDKSGEMGTPNLVFKALRNSGVTDKLLHAVQRLGDLDLSI